MTIVQPPSPSLLLLLFTPPLTPPLIPRPHIPPLHPWPLLSLPFFLHSLSFPSSFLTARPSLPFSLPPGAPPSSPVHPFLPTCLLPLTSLPPTRPRSHSPSFPDTENGRRPLCCLPMPFQGERDGGGVFRREGERHEARSSRCLALWLAGGCRGACCGVFFCCLVRTCCLLIMVIVVAVAIMTMMTSMLMRLTFVSFWYTVTAAAVVGLFAVAVPKIPVTSAVNVSYWCRILGLL